MTDLTLRFNGPIPRYLTPLPTGTILSARRLWETCYHQRQRKKQLHKKTLNRYPSQKKKQSQH
ncbi:hypothetical protein RYZ26_15170 [Terasakiella sp. A23]|uniref:hypothetical protein n=1 Tax=Terasakiella sp. FCG-A23 TaxID=3080561 RepID=UPI002955CB71|nr:hypothetical protein [Terasakiella sp. A23]MDV7340946.1 hypothetical protein [Terasakiella sp. A23]